MPRFEYSVTVCLREIEARIAVAIAQLRSLGTSQREAARSAATAIRAGAPLPGDETERAAAIAALPQRSREVIVSLMLAGGDLGLGDRPCELCPPGYAWPIEACLGVRFATATTLKKWAVRCETGAAAEVRACATRAGRRVLLELAKSWFLCYRKLNLFRSSGGMQ